MNVLLDDEMLAVQKAIRTFLEGECPVAVVRAAERRDSRMDADLWRKLADLGWLGLCLPEALGGQGLPETYLAILFEELGRHMAPLPAHAAMVPMQILASYGAPAQKALLREATAGRLIFSHAVQEADGLWDIDAVTTSARRDGDGILVEGEKYFVDHVGNSSMCLVVVRFHEDAAEAPQPAAVLIDLKAEGVSQRALGPLAKDRQSILVLDKVRVSAANLVSDARVVREMMDLSSLLMAAQMQGAARRAMEVAVDYVNQREAFGQPIGAFQAIQHMAADMLNAVDGSQLLVREAMWLMSQGLVSTIEASQAKAFANEQCLKVCRCTQQMHGGMGFIEECDINLWYRRVAAWGLRSGTTHEHRRRIASALLDAPGRVRLGMTLGDRETAIDGGSDQLRLGVRP